MATGGPLRQPIPVARSILWGPVAAGARRPGEISFPVFLLQSALAAIYEHLAAPPRPGQGMLGFLLGDLCECPDTNVSYLVVDAALRLNQAIYGDRTRDVVTRLWDRVQAQLEEQKAHLIGWYHSHPPLPLGLTEHDVETHEQYFSEPWQVSLLMGTDPAEPAGAFFRATSDAGWVSAPQPFYELLNPDSIRPDGKKRSVVTWKNYRAYSPVGTQSGPHATVSPPRPAEPKFTPAPPKPREPPAPPPPPARRPPEPEPERSNELKFLTAAEDFASAPHPPPAPPRRHTPPPRPRPAPPPEPEPEPELEATAGLEVEPAAGEAGEPPVWPEEFEAPPEPESAPLGESEEQPPRAPRLRLKLPRRLKQALLVLVIGAVAAGAYWWFQPEIPVSEWSATAGKAIASKWSAFTASLSGLGAKVSAWKTKFQRTERKPTPAARPAVATKPPAKPEAAPVAAAPAASAHPSPQPVPSPPPAPAPFAALDLVGDSLTQSVRAFGERAAQFSRGQLPCAGLAGSLLAVEKRWTTYNAARKSAGVLDATHAVHDQALYARVDSVERRFEQTGCRRS
ncbi:MAG TPA: hypothetical protein VM716_07840 [Gemmatimonadales bacterium]|nr:hypothetical protein [Gemmatimonadales bacterium]